jgi:hypothetical protein
LVLFVLLLLTRRKFEMAVGCEGNRLLTRVCCMNALDTVPKQP